MPRRHACVSTWLNGGIPPAQVAEWAGHSVAILLKVYAKCIDGQDHIARRRIEDALGEPGEGDPEPSPQSVLRATLGKASCDTYREHAAWWEPLP